MNKKLESKVLDLAEEQLEKRIEKIKKNIEYYKTLRTRFTIAQSFYMISSIAAKLMAFNRPDEKQKEVFAEKFSHLSNWFPHLTLQETIDKALFESAQEVAK